MSTAPLYEKYGDGAKYRRSMSLQEDGLVLLVSWIDNILIIGSKKGFEKAKKDLIERFDCKDCGDIEEYVGCKIVRMGIP